MHSMFQLKLFLLIQHNNCFVSCVFNVCIVYCLGYQKGNTSCSYGLLLVTKHHVLIATNQQESVCVYENMSKIQIEVESQNVTKQDYSIYD